MVEALTAQVSLAEHRAAFVASAVESEAEVDDTGIVYGAEEVFDWLRDRVAGKKRSRPRPRKVAR